MDEPAAHPEGLSLGQDLRFEKRWWAFQRVCWALSLVLILLGVAGAFGRGPLSSRELHAKTFGLRYSKVERLFNPSELEVVVQPADARTLELTIPGEYEACLPVVGATPTPQSERLGPRGRTLLFAAGALDQEQTIRLSIKPKRSGSCAGRFEMGGDSLDISQLVLP
jgi:hypothetical protein